VNYSRRHELFPFADRTELEKYCEKAEASLFMFGSHSKKRPNNVVIGRTFDWKVLDMVEFGLSNFKSMEEVSSGCTVPYQVKPFLIFQGDLWESDESCSKIRNLLSDFFYENNKVEGI
jgi:ribosome production factor 2